MPPDMEPMERVVELLDIPSDPLAPAPLVMPVLAEPPPPMVEEPADPDPPIDPAAEAPPPMGPDIPEEPEPLMDPELDPDPLMEPDIPPEPLPPIDPDAPAPPPALELWAMAIGAIARAAIAALVNMILYMMMFRREGDSSTSGLPNCSLKQENSFFEQEDGCAYPYTHPSYS